MLNYYFYTNFSNTKQYKRKKVLFLHSLSQEFFFIFVNFSYFNLRKTPTFLLSMDDSLTRNNTFFFVKVLTFFNILKKFFKIKFSVKIWNSYLLFLVSSLNSIFLKTNAPQIDISFKINSHNATAYFSNKLVFFFKTGYRINYVFFLLKYFVYSIFFMNNSVKISLLLNNFVLLKTYEFMNLFFFISKFTNKKLKRRRGVTRYKLARHSYIYI